MEILERERQRPLPRRPGEQLHDGLEQARALELGLGRRTGRRGGLDAGHEPREAGGPIGPRKVDLRHEVAQELGPQAERRSSAKVDGRAGERASPVALGRGEELLAQPRLSYPSLAAQCHGRPVARAGALPCGQQRAELARSPDERREMRRGWRRDLGNRCTQPLGRPPRLRRRGDPELRAQALPHAGVLRERARSVACVREPTDQIARGTLVQRVHARAPPRPLDGAAEIAGRLHLGGETLQGRAQPCVVLVAQRERPLVVELVEQLSAAERHGLAEAVLSHEPRELARVHPDVLVAQRDAVPVGDHDIAGGRAQGPDRAAQARPRARVQHVGPEPRREPRPRMRARMQRQPGEHRASAPRARQLHPVTAAIHLQLAEDADAQHRPGEPIRHGGLTGDLTLD
jgi:hypothetical protein